MAILPRPYTDTTRYIASNTTDGSTVFTDSSGNSFLITITGDTQHSTAQHKFGTSAIKINNSAGTISAGAPENFVAIDFWIYLNEYPSVTQNIMTSSDSGVTTCFLSLTSGGTLTQQWYKLSGSPLTRTLPLGTWTHVFMYAGYSITSTYVEGAYNPYTGLWTAPYYTYSATYSVKLAVNGNLVQTTFTSGSLPIPASGVLFSNFNGYLDDIFITSNSTPPTASFDVPTGTASATAAFISGIVLKGTSFISRTVCAYDQTTRLLLGTAISDETTGEFTISNIPLTTTLARLICEKTSAEEKSLIIDDIVPGVV